MRDINLTSFWGDKPAIVWTKARNITIFAEVYLKFSRYREKKKSDCLYLVLRIPVQHDHIPRTSHNID